MQRSESIVKLTKALCGFQSEVTNPINTKVNAFLKNKYAPLDVVLNVVRPMLSKYGLSIIQEPSNIEDKISITTTLFYDDEWIQSEPLSVKPDKPGCQNAAAVITYLRRYSLSAILGISSEDDTDGEESKKKKSTTKTPVDKKIKEIKDIAAELISQNKDNEKFIIEVIKANHKDSKGSPSANFNTVEDIEVAQKIINELIKMKEGK